MRFELIINRKTAKANRPDDPSASADASEQSDQVIEKNEAAMLGLNSILHRLNNV